ncbi:uncharacterized protein LOC126907599 [Daktulosphaira vitifoliae]|uniref:uncharacterized protein LOC126907599 n=1 Tax=Daktulosphaira vitifoliae TaxID=58002 RepID=UPI0021AA6F16|nr:uncharacterized protein LOC126907599 [Daktulosphaira vitifoliae]
MHSTRTGSRRPDVPHAHDYGQAVSSQRVTKQPSPAVVRQNMSGSSMCCHFARSAIVAVAALASCTDAATIVFKMKDSADMGFKPARTTVLAGTSAAETLSDIKGKSSSTSVEGGFNFTTISLNVANNVSHTLDQEDQDGITDEDALSAVWYLAAFGGLVLFFFVVTCSELFFGNPIYTRRPVELPHAGYLRRHVYGLRNQGYTPETPPPPYHLFAPPSYADTLKGLPAYDSSKKLIDVFVVPVHGSDTAVASLQSATNVVPATAVDDRKQIALTKS